MPLLDLTKITTGVSKTWLLRDWNRSLRSGNYPEVARYNYLLATARLAVYLGGAGTSALCSVRPGSLSAGPGLIGNVQRADGGGWAREDGRHDIACTSRGVLRAGALCGCAP